MGDPAHTALNPSMILNALTEPEPGWADQDMFESDREKMLQHGISMGMTKEELFRITDPDVILSLWTAAEVSNSEEM